PKAHTAGGLAAGRPMNERAEQRAGLGSQRQEHRLVSIEIPLVAAYPSSDGLELGVGRADRVAPGIVDEVDTWEGQALEHADEMLQGGMGHVLVLASPCSALGRLCHRRRAGSPLRSPVAERVVARTHAAWQRATRGHRFERRVVSKRYDAGRSAVVGGRGRSVAHPLLDSSTWQRNSVSKRARGWTST